MTGLALVVFVVLYFVKAGYGILYNHSPRWGKTINNQWAWFFMEMPMFVAMLIFWLTSSYRFQTVPLIIFLLFEIHYFKRAFIFPFRLKGKSQMPLAIMSMGIIFNMLNAVMQGYWLFHEAHKDIYITHAPFGYPDEWLLDPRFIAGTLLFVVGYIINTRSDNIIQHLRGNKNDTRHYLPKGGMFNYVTNANYFGELVEWLGFALLSWSLAGFVFFLWTFANLVPRAHATYQRYLADFGPEVKQRKLKRIFPFLY
jgi:3-oxo-5-alpha-steroid 4-dehydrogenase 1